MPKTREPRGDEQARVDMTPMIDVTFLLIIFFVTIQQLTVMEVAAEVTLPRAKQANPESAEDKDRLIISVDADGWFYVGNDRLDISGLSKTLKAEAGPPGANTKYRDAEGFAKRVIFIRADVASPYGKVQDIMAECRKHRFYKLSFRVREWK